MALGGPSLIRMAAASPLRVLRRDTPSSAASRWLYLSGVVALLLLLYGYARDIRLALLVLACFTLVAGTVGAIAYALLRRARLPGVRAHSAVRLALAGLQRHARLNSLQMLVFALCLMLVLIMLLVRTALIEDWRKAMPPGTPNHFLVNIAPYQLQPVEAFLATHGVRHAGLYPMVAGRVLSVNDSPVRVREGEELDIEREFNLTWADDLPVDNAIIAGRWWAADVRDEVSAEESVARALGLTVGDRLTIQIGADRFDARLTSIRKLDWNTMRPNFYLMFPRLALQRYTGTSITSFYISAGQKPLLTELVRKFPTLSVLEMDAILGQLRAISRQLAQAIELVLALLTVAGALVMVASVQSGLDERFQESAILRTLGAPRRLVLGALVIEFALLGLVSGLLAAAGAELAAWYVQTRLMELPFKLHPLVWLAGPLGGALLAALLGFLNCRAVVTTPPLIVLREAG
jgi:putative ABC transport system permease protein